MNERIGRPGDIVTRIKADRLLGSVGIPLLLASERLFNECEHITPLDLVQISSDLYTLSAVLAALCTQYEHRLKTFEVDLPEEIGAMVAPNPLYRGDTTKPVLDDAGDVVDLGDELPF